jgi:hypothetical protein
MSMWVCVMPIQKVAPKDVSVLRDAFPDLARPPDHQERCLDRSVRSRRSMMFYAVSGDIPRKDKDRRQWQRRQLPLRRRLCRLSLQLLGRGG